MADEQGTTQPDTIARSIHGVLRRTRSALSPWVQRHLDDTAGDSGRAGGARRRLGGLAVAQPRTVVRLTAPSLVMRLQAAPQTETPGTEPLVDRFSTGVIQRHSAMIGSEARFRHDTLQPQIPAPSVLPLPGVPGGQVQRSAAPGEISLEQLAALHAAETSASSADIQRTPEGAGGFTTEGVGPAPTLADIQDAIRRAAQSGAFPAIQSSPDVQRSSVPASAGTLDEIEARVREARARQLSATSGTETGGTVQRAPDASGGLLAEIERRVQEARARSSTGESVAGALPLSTVPRGGIQRAPEEGGVLAEIERRIQAARAAQAQPPSAPSPTAPDLQTERAAPSTPPSPPSAPPVPPPPSPPAESVQRVPLPGDPDYSAAAEMHRRLAEMRARRAQLAAKAVSSSSPAEASPSTAAPTGETVQRTPDAETPSAPPTPTPPAPPSVEEIEERVRRMRDPQQRATPPAPQAVPPTVQRSPRPSTSRPSAPRPPGAPADRRAMWLAPPRSERTKDPAPDPLEAARLQADMARVQRMRDERLRAQAELDAARAARGEVVQRTPQPGDPAYSVTSVLNERATASRDRHEKRLRGELPPLVRRYSSDPESPDYSKFTAIKERLQRAAELRAAVARGDVIPAPRYSTDPDSPRYSRAAAISERIRQAREQAAQRAVASPPPPQSPAPPAPEAAPPTADAPPPVVHRTVERESTIPTISRETGRPEVRRVRAFSRSVVLTPERKQGLSSLASEAPAPTPETSTPAAPTPPSSEIAQRSSAPPASATPSSPASPPSDSETVQRAAQPRDRGFSATEELRRRLAEARERRAAQSAQPGGSAPSGPSPAASTPATPAPAENVQRTPQPGDANYSRAAEIRQRLAAARARRAAQAASTGAESVQRAPDSTGSSSESSGAPASTDEEESSRVQRSVEATAPVPPPEQQISAASGTSSDAPLSPTTAPTASTAPDSVQRSVAQSETRSEPESPSTFEPISRVSEPRTQRLADEHASPVESTPTEPSVTEPSATGPVVADTVSRSAESPAAMPPVQRQEETAVPTSPVAGPTSPDAGPGIQREASPPSAAPDQPIQRTALTDTAPTHSSPDSTSASRSSSGTTEVDSRPDTVQRSAEASPQASAAPESHTPAPPGDTVAQTPEQGSAVQRSPEILPAAPDTSADAPPAPIQASAEGTQESADTPLQRTPEASPRSEPSTPTAPDRSAGVELPAPSLPEPSVQRSSETAVPTLPQEPSAAVRHTAAPETSAATSPDKPVVQRMPEPPAESASKPAAPSGAPAMPDAPTDAPTVQKSPDDRISPPVDHPTVQRSPAAGTSTPEPETASGSSAAPTIVPAAEPSAPVQREPDLARPAPPQPASREARPTEPARAAERPVSRPSAAASAPEVQRTPHTPSLPTSSRATPPTPAPRARSAAPPPSVSPSAPPSTGSGKPAFLQRRPQDEPKIEWAKPDEVDQETLRRLADLDAGFFGTGPSSAAAKPEDQAAWSPVTRRQGDPRLLARTPSEGTRRTKSGSSLSTPLVEERTVRRSAKKGQPMPLPALRLPATGQRLQRVVGEDDSEDGVEGEKTTNEGEREGWVPTGPTPSAPRNLQIGAHRSGESSSGPSRSPTPPSTLINPRSRGDEDDMSMGGASHLDALARQILPIVKRMMAIERERRPVR